MHKTRLAILGAFALLLSLGAFVVSSDAQPNTIKAIIPGVWFREGDLKNLGHCNNAIIEMKDYLIVVDANFPSGARAAMADAKKVSPKPVKYVFDTHHHGDHAYGNAVWTQAGAITIAHANVVGEMKRREPGRWQNTAKTRKDVSELNQASVEPPKETFTKSPHVITDGTRRVELHHFGWAHTRGDGFLYLPNEKLVCTGDAAVNGPYNATMDANLTNWPNVIRSVEKLDITRVLPGHGPAGGKEILAGQIQFMVELRKAVEAAVKKGKKSDDLVKMEKDKPVSTTIILPDSVKNWVGPSLPTQVKHMFEELTQKKPSGDINQN